MTLDELKELIANDAVLAVSKWNWLTTAMASLLLIRHKSGLSESLSG